MHQLSDIDILLVQQKKEWTEILTGIETKNRYSITDPNGNQIGMAAEESSFLGRFFLRTLRSFTIHILSPAGDPILRLEKTFSWYFHEIRAFTSQDEFLGTVRREFAVFSRDFTVLDARNDYLFAIRGPFFRPWTFRVEKNNMEVGLIAKKWTGMGKEIFTDADNFNIAFPAATDTTQKSVLLGALFLIDMIYFERSD